MPDWFPSIWGMIRIRNLPSIIFLNLFSLRNVSPQTPSSEVHFGPWDSPAFLQKWFLACFAFWAVRFSFFAAFAATHIRKAFPTLLGFHDSIPFHNAPHRFQPERIDQIFHLSSFRCHLRIFKKKFLCWKTSCSIPFTYFRSKRSCLL